MANHVMGETTIRGFNLGECISAVQKAIRRGNEPEAVTFACEIDQSGYGDMLWTRLLVITSEDVGLASPHLPGTIRALYENYLLFKGRKRFTTTRLFTMNAVILLTRAKKSRAVDNCIWATYGCDKPLVSEIPDYALDQHTARGKALGRGWDFFQHESMRIENPSDTPDPYHDRFWVEKVPNKDTFRKQGTTAEINETRPLFQYDID